MNHKFRLDCNNQKDFSQFAWNVLLSALFFCRNQAHIQSWCHSGATPWCFISLKSIVMNLDIHEPAVRCIASTVWVPSRLRKQFLSGLWSRPTFHLFGGTLSNLKQCLLRSTCSTPYPSNSGHASWPIQQRQQDGASQHPTQVRYQDDMCTQRNAKFMLLCRILKLCHAWVVVARSKNILTSELKNFFSEMWLSVSALLCKFINKTTHSDLSYTQWTVNTQDLLLFDHRCAHIITL